MIYILSQILTFATVHYFYNNGIIYTVVEYKDDVQKKYYRYPYTGVEYANTYRQINEFSYTVPDVMVKIGDDCDALLMVKREIEYKIFENI